MRSAFPFGEVPQFLQSQASRNERLRHGAILWEAQVAPIAQRSHVLCSCVGVRCVVLSSSAVLKKEFATRVGSCEVDTS